MADINQDFLLAVLAMITGPVPREYLRSALLAWAECPERPLGELLKERGNLDENRVKALNCLVSAHHRQNNSDLGASLDAWDAQALTQDMWTKLKNTPPGSTLGATLAATLASTRGWGRFRVRLGAPELHPGPAVQADSSACQGGYRPGLAGPRSRAPARCCGQALTSQTFAANVFVFPGITRAPDLRAASLGNRRAIRSLPPLVALAMSRLGLHGSIPIPPFVRHFGTRSEL